MRLLSIIITVIYICVVIAGIIELSRAEEINYMNIIVNLLGLYYAGMALFYGIKQIANEDD